MKAAASTPALGQGPQVVGVSVGAAGDQRDGVALGTESVRHGHAEAGPGAEDDENWTVIS